jgi:hypothetical protein
VIGGRLRLLAMRSASWSVPTPVGTTTITAFICCDVDWLSYRRSGAKSSRRSHPARHRALQQHITVTIPTPSGPVVDHAATERMAAGTSATNANNPGLPTTEVTAAH